MAAADPVLAAAGDVACAPGSTSTSTSCQQNATSNLVLAAAPTAVAVLGDEQYPSGSLSQFNGLGAFNDTWGRAKPNMYPSPGNHEYATANAAGYFSYFGAAAGPGTQGYYSFDLGAWHIISLNSNCSNSGCPSTDSGQVSSAETAWLQNDLAAHAGRCTLAYWHHPRFTSNSDEDSPGVGPLWNALYAAKADLILNGHIHNYERFGLQDPTGHATAAGIREFIVGSGGVNLESFTGAAVTNSQFRDDHDFGILLLTLHPGRYDWNFERLDGTILDSGSALCHFQPPAATTGAADSITASAAALNATVNPENEVTTYHFDYGTSASYGAQVPASEASVGSDSTDHAISQALSGLAPHTLYHFRIVATNAAGVSYGADQTLTTAFQAPAASTAGASSVSDSTAALNGTINPNGSAVTDCHFDYGTGGAYDASVPCLKTVGGGSSPVPVIAALSGLSAGVTYHYRVVATNAGGTTDGSDQTFTTVARSAATMTTSLSPSSIDANGFASTTATVAVKDASGNPVAGDAVSLSSSDSIEYISAIADHGNGTYTATITGSTRIGGVTITATDGSLSARTTLWLHGAASSMTLLVSPNSILANGTSTTKATVTVSDPSGVPVGGEAILLSSSDSAEQISNVIDHGDGTYTATITSSTIAGTATITATDGSLFVAATLGQTSQAKPRHLIRPSGATTGLPVGASRYVILSFSEPIFLPPQLPVTR